jgi:phosphatidylserine decarboxylase
MMVRQEVLPFLGAVWIAAGVLLGLLLATRAGRAGRGRLVGIAAVFGVVLSGYMLWFFRDPPRPAPTDANAVVAGADGRLAALRTLTREELVSHLERVGVGEEQVGRLAQGDCVRISIFLSLFDVHVNRAPISGLSTFLGYFPGKRYFTFQEKSSEENQHNAIFMANERTCCLVTQIVGPVCRRVVYWPDPDAAVPLKAGDRIGMMKFGSRLDMYLPASDVEVVARVGDRVRAGVTVVAQLSAGKEQER